MKLALVGRSGAGKSTCATALSQQLGLQHIKTGAICRQVTQLLFQSQDKIALQRVNDALISLEPSLFLEATLRNNSSWQLAGCVIDSIRYKSDVEILRRLDFKFVRIACDRETRIARLKVRDDSYSEAAELHPTENELTDLATDFQLDNSGSLDELATQVDRLTKQFTLW